MRKLLFLVLLGGAIGLVSCQKEVEGVLPGSNPVTGDFKAKIDGNQWVANSAAGAQRMNGFIVISGRSSDRKYLQIMLTDSALHTYTLSNTSFNAASYIDSTLPNPINFTTNQGVNPGDAGGTVTITSIDAVNKKISGTFSFKAFRQVDGLQRTFTEGIFTNLSYTTTLPPGNATDTLHVKRNGVLWTPATVNGVLSPAVPPLLPAKIGINGTGTTGPPTIGLQLPATIVPGTYSITFFGDYTGLYLPDSDPTTGQMSESGTLTILSHNTTTRRIRGNFNFKSEQLANPSISTQFTEGYFAITYQ